MALTSEVLKANAQTAGLSDEQINSIVEMSQNDENAVIGKRIGEVYRQLDEDIAKTSGIQRQETEKTYDYAKRVIGEIKTQAGNATQLQTQVNELTKERDRLQKVINDGGADEETKKALKKANADLADVQTKYAELNTKFENANKEHEKAVFDMKVDNEIAKVRGAIKFKADLPASVTSVLMDQAIAKVKGMNPEFIDDGNGGKVLAFSENGTTMRNPQNSLRPYTAAELIQRELTTMGVIETGRQQTGAGSQGGTGGGGGHESGFDLSDCTTQDEAERLITKELLSRGITRGSKEFDDAKQKAWKDNWEILKKLPLK